ncbi:MAG TPA: epimerase, partial [Alcanivorax sp.]|nr:epimerase [Alcanivorax sp.]
MKVLITGGSGFIGGELCRRLAAHGHALTVLSRSPARARSKLPEGTRVVASLDDIGDDEAIDGIVNLAGENL